MSLGQTEIISQDYSVPYYHLLHDEWMMIIKIKIVTVQLLDLGCGPIFTDFLDKFLFFCLIFLLMIIFEEEYPVLRTVLEQERHRRSSKIKTDIGRTVGNWDANSAPPFPHDDYHNMSSTWNHII